MQEAGSVEKVENEEVKVENEVSTEAPVENTTAEENAKPGELELVSEPAEEKLEDVKTEEEFEEEEDEELAARRANLNLDTETALLETVFFLESNPQNIESLSKITKFAPHVVEKCLGRLKEKYTNADSGIELSQMLGGWILTPKRECFDFVKERYGKKNEGKLSKSAIETLSIIAYSQPITRAEIESIRHVNVDNMMRVLLDRNFICEKGKKDIPGKPTLYGTTNEFLEFFHLQSIDDLPKLDDNENERFLKLAK
ncbi:MAG: SMC-Scp complex subunit ScpB [Treponema sp.]|nr:SMC-Scp complex subunit ScpB [Candidatus Treponema equi]